MSARHLILGLDGVDLSIIRSMGAERLPVMHALMRTGAYSHQRSVLPPATLPNWTTFLTGVEPGLHGVIDFTTRRGYRVRFTAGAAREVPTVFSRLDRKGLKCACIGFPATYPPERLEHGVFISGWDAPVAFEADSSFIWPPSLHRTIVEKFGATRFDDVNEFEADSPGWLERLPGALTARIERKVAMAEWLLDAREWDVFALYFGESDTAAHYLWSLHDPQSPRHPASVEPESATSLTKIYMALDEAVGALRARAGRDNVELTLLSDHGSGGSSDKVLYLNRALHDAGLLEFKRSDNSATWLKEQALTRLSPRMRERLFQLGGRSLPGWLESRARFGNIDMRRTLAFSDELNYFPAVHLNLDGREQSGQVALRDTASITQRVEAALYALRDPWSGRPVVNQVLRRREVFSGPYAHRAPDLMIDFHLDEGYSYNLMPSGGAPKGTGPWRRLNRSEWLGRKGRSLPGSHRTRGFFLAHGPSIAPTQEIDSHIADATATLLARLGIRVPVNFMGRPLWEALSETLPGATDLPKTMLRRNHGPHDESRVEARLRALGYID